MSMEASFYILNNDNSVTCRLCPHNCVIKKGKTGICRVRTNNNGKLISLSHGFISSIHSDPVEKKPLYHYYPGKNVLSIGSAGCNMRCDCCQNWQISQSAPEGIRSGTHISPEKIADMALQVENNIGVAYTYNEPTVWFEYMIDIARIVSEAGMKNVVVSNGYINPEPLDNLLVYADAFNIDLKAFDDNTYRKITGAGLDPVLNSLRRIKKSGRHLEITNLIIPGLNDDLSGFMEMISWVDKELGKDTVLHLSRYYPAYRMETGPAGAGTLKELFDAASQVLSYVYLGNIYIEGCQDTKCRKCGSKLIKRSGYYTETNGVRADGSCIYCGEKVVICQ